MPSKLILNGPLFFIYLFIFHFLLDISLTHLFDERRVRWKHVVRTFGIRQTCVVHTLLIIHERYANAGRTLLYAVISHGMPGIRYE